MDLNPDEIISNEMIQQIGGAIVTSVVCVVEYVDNEGETCFSTLSDTVSGPWKHLGMLECAGNDIRLAMRLAFMGDDD